MGCICQARLNSENRVEHTVECDLYNVRLAREQAAWNKQDHQCSGPGYAHAAHGQCRGYGTDRT